LVLRKPKSSRTIQTSKLKDAVTQQTSVDYDDDDGTRPNATAARFCADGAT